MYTDFFVINKHFDDLNPLSCGHEKCSSGHSFGPSIRNCYLIHYVISGQGTFYTEKNQYTVSEGELFLIRPGEVTTYTADKINPWHYIWISFDGKLAKKLDKLIIPVFPYKEKTFSDILHCDEKSNMREAFLASKLFEIMTNIFDNEGAVLRYERIAHDYIAANFMQHNISIEEIAKRLGINRQHLSRLFKAEYNITMQDFLVQTRLHYAAIYLQRGYSVAEAAAMSGYKDAFNFSKIFKKKYGISPRACRLAP